jgi:hypothetical protein
MSQKPVPDIFLSSSHHSSYQNTPRQQAVLNAP